MNRTRQNLHHTSFFVKIDRGTISVVPEMQAKAAAKASAGSRDSRIFSAVLRKCAIACSVTLSNALQRQFDHDDFDSVMDLLDRISCRSTE